MGSQNDKRLSRLALLYLSMAHRSDEFLSTAELESVTESLAQRAGHDAAAVQAVVMQELERFTQREDLDEIVLAAARELADELSAVERDEVLGDLGKIAQADGVVLKHESGLLRTLARMWEVPLREDEDLRPDEPWGVLHDLSYIYLTLAHSTDNDLAGTEMLVMLNKLREWQPEAPVEDARRMLRLAMDEYAQGQDADRLEAAIASVRRVLPHTQRMAALNDLVKIANADGLFLDDEEDLINHLQAEWDVDPSANYEPHGDKG